MKKTLAQIMAERKLALDEVLLRSPRVVRQAGKIIRDGDLKKFRKFLRRAGLIIQAEEAADFRDYLITQRIDMKDLEPEARARLRRKILDQQDAASATADYRDSVLSGTDLRCKHCSWFVTAPMDDDGDRHSKTCVELGAKGIDKACVGFLWPLTGTKSA